MLRLTLVMLALAGCADHGLVPCGDLACPRGFVCTTAGCASAEQLAACDLLEDGEPCTTPAIDGGFCMAGACWATVCGDGIVAPDEACDDENVTPRDGCSSDCRSAEVCGDTFVDPVVGEECDSGLAGRSSDGCASRCSVELEVWRDGSPAAIAAAIDIGMAYDEARQVVVVFGNIGALAQTWEWNGTSWRRRTPPDSPSPRKDHALAYDAVNERIVLFGGRDGGTLLGDTWEWDGTTWTERTVAEPPKPRAGHAMAAVPGGVVMFGGSKTLANGGAELTNELVVWNGVSWTTLQSGTTPPSPRADAAMAYDERRELLVVYGGDETDVNVWEWNAGTWSSIARPSHPPPISKGELAFFGDELTGYMLLFGGQGSPLTGSSTWSWDGTSWSLLEQQSLESRFAHAMTYDSGRGRVVLFGGTNISASTEDPLADTWEWDGDWARRPADFAPSPRYGHSCVYDAARGQAVLFGGQVSLTDLRDTWVWDGTNWSQRTGAPRPTARHSAASAYDVDRRLVVMFGGVGADRVDDTWEWDGSQWKPISPQQSPPPRSESALAYDAHRKQMILFGGAGVNGQPTNGMWIYEPGASPAQATWRPLTPLSLPGKRSGHLMVYDARRGVIVLHGGHDGGVTLRDTWEWNGIDWSEIELPSSPPARRGAVLVYDPFRERPTLIGGQLDGAQLDDSWEWDGTSWTELVPLVRPPRRDAAAMIYDEARRELVLFGGRSGSSALGETWLRTFVSPRHAAERCERPIDTDGDGLAGCDDPDCAGRCRHCDDGTCSPVEDYLICPADCSLP